MTALAGLTVGVVEDSYLLAMEVKAVLEGAGAAVIGPFPTVADTRASLQQRRPDCMVLDVSLGDSTSLDLARTLRLRRIPFLFVTGYDAAALPPEFATVDWVEKPVDAARLRQAVMSCCWSARPIPMAGAAERSS